MTDHSRARRQLLVAHAVVTAAAAAVLALRPAAIPGAVGIHLAPDAYLLSYLLAAAECSVAVLSWLGAGLTDVAAVRAIIWGFVVLHAFSALFAAAVWTALPSRVLAANIVVRLVVVAAFLWVLPRRRAGGGG